MERVKDYMAASKEFVTNFGAFSRAGAGYAKDLTVGAVGGFFRPGLERLPGYSGTGVDSFVGRAGFYSADTARATGVLAGQSMWEGTKMVAKAPWALPRGYNKWRKGAIRDAAMQRGKGYGFSIDKSTGRKKVWRDFHARSAGEHFAKGMRNMSSMINPLSIGLNVGLATIMSSDNLFDPAEGFMRQMATNVGAEAGFFAGGTGGAMLAARLAPLSGAAASLGFLGMGLAGAALGMAVADAAWKVSEFGNRFGRLKNKHKSAFLDSDYAMTMRQRAFESINRSQMSARSAFGSEALAYHA